MIRRYPFRIAPILQSWREADMKEARVIQAVHEFFHREYGADAPKTFCTECARWDLGGRADIVFVQSRSDVIHVVEAKSTLSGAFSAVDQVLRYPANHRWIAFPADEYIAGAGLLKASSDEGIGVLLVHDRVRNRVEVKRWPQREEGNFLSDWPRLERAWYSGE